MAAIHRHLFKVLCACIAIVGGEGLSLDDSVDSHQREVQEEERARSFVRYEQMPLDPESLEPAAGSRKHRGRRQNDALEPMEASHSSILAVTSDGTGKNDSKGNGADKSKDDSKGNGADKSKNDSKGNGESKKDDANAGEGESKKDDANASEGEKKTSNKSASKGESKKTSQPSKDSEGDARAKEDQKAIDDAHKGHNHTAAEHKWDDKAANSNEDNAIIKKVEDIVNVTGEEDSDNEETQSAGLGWLWWTLGSLLVVGLIGGGIFFYTRGGSASGAASGSGAAGAAGATGVDGTAPADAGEAAAPADANTLGAAY